MAEAPPIAVLVRHGAYHQRAGAPSALQPFALTQQGQDQARACGAEIARIAGDSGLMLAPVIHCSMQLRAWQTADAIRGVLQGSGTATSVMETAALAERGMGSAANLTVDEIGDVLAADPRYDAPPAGWKSDSHYSLPLQGAESLMQAGARVASHLREVMAAATPGTMTVFVGHGASLRHAAHLLGLFPFERIAALSMYHARPLQICYNGHDNWAHIGGVWKQRQKSEPHLD